MCVNFSSSWPLFWRRSMEWIKRENYFRVTQYACQQFLNFTRATESHSWTLPKTDYAGSCKQHAQRCEKTMLSTLFELRLVILFGTHHHSHQPECFRCFRNFWRKSQVCRARLMMVLLFGHKLNDINTFEEIQAMRWVWFPCKITATKKCKSWIDMSSLLLRTEQCWINFYS